MFKYLFLHYFYYKMKYMKIYYYCPKDRKLTEAMKVLANALYASHEDIEFTDLKPWENLDTFRDTTVCFYDAIDLFPEAFPYIGIGAKHDFLIAKREDLGDLDISKLADRCLQLFQNQTKVIFERGSQCNMDFIMKLEADFDSRNKVYSNQKKDRYKQLLEYMIRHYLLEKQRLSAYILTRKVASELNESHMGIKKGQRLTTKKSVLMKKQILQLSKDFNGSLPDTELMKELGIARNTYYKYKRELRKESGNAHNKTQ